MDKASGDVNVETKVFAVSLRLMCVQANSEDEIYLKSTNSLRLKAHDNANVPAAVSKK